MKTGRGLVLAAVVALGVAACSSGGGSGGSGNAGAVHQVECFAKVTSSQGYAGFTIQMLGVPDCTPLSDSVDAIGYGYHAAPNTGSATGPEICSGAIGNAPVNIYGTVGDFGVCQDFNLSDVP